MDYPAFSSFRSLLTTWDTYLEQEERENKVRDLLDGHGLIMFFKAGSDLFGAPEESRVTFARMFDPDGDDEFMDQATFMAVNLLSALTGGGQRAVFNSKDLKKIKVVPREKCEKVLLRHAAKPTKADKINTKQNKDHGYIKLDDEE